MITIFCIEESIKIGFMQEDFFFLNEKFDCIVLMLINLNKKLYRM